MAPTAFSATKKFYGITTLDLQTTASASVIGWTGLKAGVAELTVEQKQTVLEFEDGSEVKQAEGWTGTLKFALGQLDQTDLATLEDNAPGQGSTPIAKAKFTFTDRGTGSDYHVTISGLDSLKPGLQTGDYWQTTCEFGISAAADQNLHDFVTIAHA